MKCYFIEYYNCLFGVEYRKIVIRFLNLIRSTNHEMYLQKVCKSSLSAFDENGVKYIILKV